MIDLAINAGRGTPIWSDGAAVDAPSLAAALGRHPEAAPLVVLVHGYRYVPQKRRLSPHATLFGMRWCEGLRVHAPVEPVLIGFGWHALGVGRTPLATLRGAYRRAVPAAGALAQLFALLARVAPERPVNVLAHSLGGRVALLACRASPHAALGRFVLMGPAEFREKAQQAIEPHLGSGLEIYNVIAAENRLFDRLFRRIVAPRRRDGVLGEGLGLADPLCARHWLDLDLDDPRLGALLAEEGISLAPRRALVDHWGFYRREGTLAFYSRLLSGGANWSIPALRQALARVVLSAPAGKAPAMDGDNVADPGL